MIVLSWNCRGICNRKFLRNCKELVRQHKATIFILMELKCNDVQVARDFGRKIGFDSHFMVPSTGMAGGIFFLWHGHLNIQVLGFTNQAVHVQVSELNRTWCLSGVYVQPHCHLKAEFWDNLQLLSQTMSMPWLVMGDFNDIASMEEKSGGADYRVNAARKFVERWEDCRLSDFANASGLTMNLAKSKLFISPNVPRKSMTLLSSACGIPLADDLGLYLGVPIVHKRASKELYGRLVDKVRNRLCSCKKNVLSRAGRRTLVQSVLNAIPVYTMQTAFLPASICSQLDRLARNFL